MIRQRVCFHYYVIITYFDAIATKGPVITHYYIFQSPEIADKNPEPFMD